MATAYAFPFRAEIWKCERCFLKRTSDFRIGFVRHRADLQTQNRNPIERHQCSRCFLISRSFRTHHRALRLGSGLHRSVMSTADAACAQLSGPAGTHVEFFGLRSLGSPARLLGGVLERRSRSAWSRQLAALVSRPWPNGVEA